MCLGLAVGGRVFGDEAVDLFGVFLEAGDEGVEPGGVVEGVGSPGADGFSFGEGFVFDGGEFGVGEFEDEVLCGGGVGVGLVAGHELLDDDDGFGGDFDGGGEPVVDGSGGDAAFFGEPGAVAVGFFKPLADSFFFDAHGLREHEIV